MDTDCLATAPVIKRPNRKIEMGLVAGLVAFTVFGTKRLTNMANANGRKMTKANCLNMPKVSTLTLAPYRSLVSNGMVKGAKREVVTVNTKAKDCFPPMTSANNGAVIPTGMAANRNNAKAKSPPHEPTANHVSTGKPMSIRKLAHPKNFQSFRCAPTCLGSILMQDKKKIACNIYVFHHTNALACGTNSPTAKAKVMITKYDSDNQRKIRGITQTFYIELRITGITRNHKE